MAFFKNRRREHVRSAPFPVEWRAAIQRNFATFDRLSAADQRELVDHVKVFIAEKHFEGCGGLEITDEIRVTIAAQACLLLLHRDTDYYPELISILVYPTAYIAHEEVPVGGGIWRDGDSARLGETGERLGALVLAWDAVLRGAADPADGENVVFHEFAHQLDFEDRSGDGTPQLETRTAYATWARVMGREFESLQRADENGSPTLIDKYGATNPAEFFAVATEAFFERPVALKRDHAELFDALAEFYKQDPTSYSAERDSA